MEFSPSCILLKLCFVTHFICFCKCLSFCPEAIILVKQLLLMVVSCISFKRFDSILKFAIYFFCFKFTLDIGLDFVLNFNIISYNVVNVCIVICFICVYYHVNLLPYIPLLFVANCYIFEKWNAEINQTETEKYILHGCVFGNALLLQKEQG